MFWGLYPEQKPSLNVYVERHEQQRSHNLHMLQPSSYKPGLLGHKIPAIPQWSSMCLKSGNEAQGQQASRAKEIHGQ
eukprot:2495629-Amphidinium_carterae.1